ncbi:MAG: polyprenyl synthetase family protein [Caldisericaceae bacterium]
MNVESYLEEKKHIIDIALENTLQPLKDNSLLYAAMSYSLLLGGKRIRPILMLSSYEATREDSSGILPFACAIEMIHTYSLIHDDLPIMDNSDMRRGRASCHKVYGSDMALLAGDALLSYAFELVSIPVSSKEIGYDRLIRVINLFASASGVKGLVGGQVMDMVSTSEEEIALETVTYIDRLKTASLIKLAVESGGILAGIEDEELLSLGRFGENLGVSYQAIDDVLDETSSADVLGKDTGQDKKNKKATFVALLGVDGAKKHARTLLDKAIDFLKPYGDKYEVLKEIAEFSYERIK